MLKPFFIFLFLTGIIFSCFAQSGGDAPQPRILLLLDRSSSMTYLWDGNKPKTKVADELILRIMDSVYRVNPNVEFSLRVFGHQSTVQENDCRDTRNEVPFARDNRLQMEYRLSDIRPLGVTSIAYALEQAADNDLVDISRNAYSIILITDGGESCGGDICAVMQKLSQSKVFFRPYIVNLESSATVKASYSCMGDYLEVTKSADLPVAVSKIVQAFRPVINVSKTEYIQVKEVAAKTPTVMGVKIPDVKVIDTVKTVSVHTPVVISSLPVATYMAKEPASTPILVRPRSPYPWQPVFREEEQVPEPREKLALSMLAPGSIMAIKLPAASLPKPVPTRAVIPAPVIVEERPAPEAISKLQPRNDLKPYNVTYAALPQPARTRELSYTPVIQAELPAPEKITRLIPAPPRRIIAIQVLDNGLSMRSRNRIPSLPPLKFDPVPPPKPVAKTPPAKTTTPDPEADKLAEYTVETEDADETTVEVYFTNGKGKYFPVTPQVYLLDPKTDKLIKRFYRTVDADGNPDPRKDILPGEYKMALSETRSLIVKDVVIEKDKKNKIVVVVKKASLSFEYSGNHKRPVKEFEAVVIERNKIEGGAVVRQNCTERLEYEPGNYHVEINTFPMDRRNIDLDFSEKVITILQPGFAKFTGEAGMTSVTLYQRLGNKYLSFFTLKLADPVAQNLQIQPGEYQAHYHKGPGGNFGSEKVVSFIIKSNEQTEVILN